MNLKILAFPLLVFTIMVFSIWFIYPAYLELGVTRDELDAVSENLQNIEQKIQTAERLSEEVVNNQEYQGILISILPSERSEEQIVNEMNDLIFTQGMVVSGLSFKEGSAIQMNVPTYVLDEFGNPLADPVTGQPIYGETIPQIKIVQATAEAIGDYNKIKGFLRKMISLKRTNSIASIKISKGLNGAVAENQINASDGTLKMEVTADFTYLEKVRNTIDVDDRIFTEGQFNLSGLDEIWKTKNTVVPELKTDSQGGANPFVL